MNLNNNTILITGGGSGIGLEIAKQFDALGNTVIIVGRDEKKLNNALEHLNNGVSLTADITNDEDVERLVIKIQQEFPALNILVNNAGKAYGYSLAAAADASMKATEEMITNYISAVKITERLLPLLKSKTESAVINNSSITALVPALLLPTYSASKAALHSYTQNLRLSLRNTSVKVFEIMPPLVDTAFSAGLSGNKISPAEVALDLIHALRDEEFEIHVGGTAALYRLFLSSPTAALQQLNGITE